MTNHVKPQNSGLAIFEKIKKTDNNNNEFWTARDLAEILGYSEYRHFVPVISKAQKSCENSNCKVIDHFEDLLEMVDLGSGAKRRISNVKLSRYACYLLVQNSDPAKENVAIGQTYFAIQASAAKEAGVISPIDYAIFQNHGYKGLYGGLDSKNIHKKKSLKKSQKILDHMSSTELAANLFRATQAEEKIRRDEIIVKSEANEAHFEVGKKVRQTIKELGGKMPEDMPTSESIHKIRKRIEKRNLDILARTSKFYRGDDDESQ